MHASWSSRLLRRFFFALSAAALPLWQGCGSAEVSQGLQVGMQVASAVAAANGGVSTQGVAGRSNSALNGLTPFPTSASTRNPNFGGLTPIPASFGPSASPNASQQAGLPGVDNQSGASFFRSMPLPNGVGTVGANGHYWDRRGGGSRPHHGVDLHCAKGTDVFSVADGTIELLKENPGGYGFYIIVKHSATDENGQAFKTLYGHVVKVQGLQENQAVRAGQKIAEVNDPGVSSEHLHFEVLVDDGGQVPNSDFKGTPQDPARFANFYTPGSNGANGRFAGYNPPTQSVPASTMFA